MTQSLQPENSLMFKITLIPFGDINSPAVNNERIKIKKFYIFNFSISFFAIFSISKIKIL